MSLTIDRSGHWQSLDSPGQQPRYDRIRRHLRGSVLDVGCGTGILAMDCDDYTGIEPSAEAAGLAASTGAHVRQATAEAFDPGRRKWDVILFNESLYYTRDPVAVLTKYLRALRRGGTLIISIYLRPPSSRRLPGWITRRKDNLTCAAQVERFLAGIVGRVEREDVPIGASYWRIWVARPVLQHADDAVPVGKRWIDRLRWAASFQGRGTTCGAGR